MALSLTVLNLLHPPARIVEPAIALSIVYVGADNLMVRGGRDMRAWIAFAFGLIHGFWFANGLRAIDLPARTLGWSLFSFDLGVELAQLLVIVVVGSAIVALRGRNPVRGPAPRHGRAPSSRSPRASIWFVQRVFFPGGLV